MYCLCILSEDAKLLAIGCVFVSDSSIFGSSVVAASLHYVYWCYFIIFLVCLYPTAVFFLILWCTG